MIKLTAHFSQKVPGEQDYSSDCASAGIELELADSEASQVEDKLAGMWQTIRHAIENELARATQQRADFESNSRDRGMPVPNLVSGNGNGAQSVNGTSRFPSIGNGQSNGNGQVTTNSTEPATKKQIGFLQGTARLSYDWNAEQTKVWIQNEWGKDLNSLTKAEAAQAIDALQAQAA